MKLRLVRRWARSLERSEEKKMMDADVQGDYQVMSVAVNKRMLWSSRRKIINKSRQRSRMGFKAVQRITTKEQEDSKLECRVKEKLERV